MIESCSKKCTLLSFKKSNTDELENIISLLTEREITDMRKINSKIIAMSLITHMWKKRIPENNKHIGIGDCRFPKCTMANKPVYFQVEYARIGNATYYTTPSLLDNTLKYLEYIMENIANKKFRSITAPHIAEISLNPEKESVCMTLTRTVPSHLFLGIQDIQTGTTHTKVRIMNTSRYPTVEWIPGIKFKESKIELIDR